MRHHTDLSAGAIFILSVWFLAILGWVMNIFDIVEMVNDPITGMFILRCIGVFVAPLGSILGYF
jgi:hypothetical protein